MPKPKAQSDSAIQMDAVRDGDRIVVLTPEDEDRFVRSCQWVVEASKLGISRDVWLRELHALLSHVSQWCQQRSQLVRMAYATLRDGDLAIFMVPAAGRFDYGLSEKLTELDLQLADKFRACPCDVLQNSPRSIDEGTGARRHRASGSGPACPRPAAAVSRLRHAVGATPTSVSVVTSTWPAEVLTVMVMVMV